MDRPHRRAFLELAPLGLALTLSPSFALLAARPRVPPAALLLPLTGASAALGLSMQRAAALAQPVTARDAALVALDTGGTAAGAAAAAAAALKRGAPLIVGPLFAAEVRAVLATVGGRVPVLAFSNDEALREGGAFLLGITATQAVAAILGYARRRGVRTVAVLAGDDAWSAQVAAAATRTGAAEGLGIARAPASDPAALRAAAGGELPDALLVPGGGDALAGAARALVGTGVQLLGTVQAIAAEAGAGAAAGAWIAAPDPAAFADFARSFEARNGTTPGALAALAYDAATIVGALGRAARLDRGGIVGAASFPGVTGALRFREDGSATRSLAILIGAAGGYAVAPA